MGVFYQLSTSTRRFFSLAGLSGRWRASSPAGMGTVAVFIMWNCKLKLLGNPASAISILLLKSLMRADGEMI
ncbi:MAG: hypothetical protein N2Z23_09360 [Pyrinomonadaceae bacterium]|nr:hypothetical protein [Pyrinomonadaceae bacterium]MCX7640630.1 hypothetical protein [Pyrinomonadaceae bacterium]